MQRMLICFAILMGYDLAYAPEDLPHLVIYKNHTIMQICSSFFMPSLALCAISSTSRRAFGNGWQSTTMRASFQPRRFLRVALRAFHDQLQGTLASATAESASSIRQLSVVTAVSLKCVSLFNSWTEPAHNFDLATAIQEQRNRSDGMEPKYRYPDFSHSSDFFNQHSLSFRFILNGLAQSFVGYIEDPDEEINKVEAATKTVKIKFFN